MKKTTNVKFNEKVKILDFLMIPNIDPIYTIVEVAFNDFILSFSVEMKKGISLSVKNSKINTKNFKIKNFSGSYNNFIEELRQKMMNNLINNITSLLKSTEIFGNFNQLYNEVTEGIKRFIEKPFTTGIFSLVYCSIKGGFNSIYGIGRSIGKTLSFNKNTIFYNNFLDLLKENLRYQINSKLMKVNCKFVNFNRRLSNIREQNSEASNYKNAQQS